MLVDSDAYTASVLLEDLNTRGYGRARVAANPLELAALMTEGKPVAVIVNYHSDRPDSLSACDTIRLMAPEAAVIVIVSPGPALKLVRAYAKQTHSLPSANWKRLHCSWPTCCLKAPFPPHRPTSGPRARSSTRPSCSRTSAVHRR